MAIVADGPGLHRLKADSPTANRASEATQAGVKVVARQNTMRATKRTEPDLNTCIGHVPSGVVVLTTQQAQGASYARPLMRKPERRTPFCRTLEPAASYNARIAGVVQW